MAITGSVALDKILNLANLPGFPSLQDVVNTLLVQSPNDPTLRNTDVVLGGTPVAVNDEATTTIDTPVVVDVLVNDSDPDNGPNPLTVVGVTGNSVNGGTVSIDPGATTVTYSPAAGFVGNDVFEYTITDGLATSTATVTMTVTPPPRVAPVVTPGQAFDVPADAVAGDVVDTVLATDANGTVVGFTITGGNTDVDGDTNVAFAIDAAGIITVNDPGDLIVNDPANPFSLTVQATDDQNLTGTNTVNVTVTAPVGPTEINVAGAGAETSEVGAGDFTVIFAAGGYAHTVNGFGTGDVIDLPPDFLATAAVKNLDGADGELILEGDDGTNVITITLTGIDLAQDAGVFSINSFNTVFGVGGAGSLI